MNTTVLANVGAIAIDGRVMLIEGPSGSGKSSLALALIDRGARLVGDDGVSLTRTGDRLVASPPPSTGGLFEIRNVGIVPLNATSGPVALLLALDPAAPRYPLEPEARSLLGVRIPLLRFAPGDAVQALRAEYALERYGLPFPPAGESAMDAGDD